MTGTNRSSEGLDPRRRRILFRAWRRGTREMDLIMGPFADACVGDLADVDLDELELLIELPDRDLYAWLTGSEPAPATIEGPVWTRLQAFHHSPTPSA